MRLATIVSVLATIFLGCKTIILGRKTIFLGRKTIFFSRKILFLGRKNIFLVRKTWARLFFGLMAMGLVAIIFGFAAIFLFAATTFLSLATTFLCLATAFLSLTTTFLGLATIFLGFVTIYFVLATMESDYNLGELAFRTCSTNGMWLDGEGKESFDPSWTDFTGCFTPELTKVIEGFYANITETEAEQKASILYSARLFEMVGYSISFLSILASLIILSSFRSLRTKEKRIHRHLYWAMLIQVVIRLILYTDQFVSRQSGAMGGLKSASHPDSILSIQPSSLNNVTQTPQPSALGSNLPVKGIDNTPYLCEGFYVLLEYARSAMFHWFFIEGLHLHNVLTISVFLSQGTLWIYYFIGWGLPVIFTIIWAITTGLSVDADCWYGYNHTNYYYIMEGPRLAVILINFMFLLNILRVLLTKLRNNNSSEIEQVRKAVKAAIVLQPLLGITNSLQMISTPYDQSVVYFAFWSFLTTFLVSFQGFFAALFYCFLNGEVRMVLAKYWDRRREARDINRRTSSIYHNVTTINNRQADMVARSTSIRSPNVAPNQRLKSKLPSEHNPVNGAFPNVWHIARSNSEQAGGKTATAPTYYLLLKPAAPLKEKNDFIKRQLERLAVLEDEKRQRQAGLEAAFTASLHQQHMRTMPLPVRPRTYAHVTAPRPAPAPRGPAAHLAPVTSSDDIKVMLAQQLQQFSAIRV
eukprot:maker-scaffold299_size217019-snap-gene-0.10 protein:Tk09189 transcript:maker-scaffold299_size217019-snap-gene-0.10-mRNA-1 annotation:"calcitonin receptor"